MGGGAWRVNANRPVVSGFCTPSQRTQDAPYMQASRCCEPASASYVFNLGRVAPSLAPGTNIAIERIVEGERRCRLLRAIKCQELHNPEKVFRQVQPL
jgi:hypothetical protein